MEITLSPHHLSKRSFSNSILVWLMSEDLLGFMLLKYIYFSLAASISF